MVAERDERGRFVKGNSGGGGRPKGLAAQARAATRDGAELIRFFLDVFEDTEEATKLRMQAAEWLADRGWGRAVQAIKGDMSTVVKVYQGLDLDKV